MPSCLCLVGLVQFHAGGVLYRWGEGIKPPLHQCLGYLNGWIGVFCIKLDNHPHQRAWHGGVYTHFIPQWSCNHIPVLWAVMVVVQSAIHWHLWVDIYPSTRCMPACWPFCPARHPCLLHIAWNLHESSVDALADILRRSCSFPFIHPWEVFLAWCWVIIFLWHYLAVIPSGSRLDWDGAGTSILYLLDTHT